MFYEVALEACEDFATYGNKNNKISYAKGINPLLLEIC